MLLWPRIDAQRLSPDDSENMAKLTHPAVKMLEAAGCNEIGDDLIVIGTTDVRVLLSHRGLRTGRHGSEGFLAWQEWAGIDNRRKGRARWQKRRGATAN
ncbi:hypothetical protein AWB81_07443 [Caballeronia arationis]|nr:hypothetical protein AWB81_07443 [Caballeronia arationis]